VYKKCKSQETLQTYQMVNHVKAIYEPFAYVEISKKISEMLRTPDIKAEIEIIYQTIDNLHHACPNDPGDWYFTGNYPTPGGNKIVNTAFINYIEGKTK
jgi:amidophosphoribosyltransferase